MRRMLFLIGLFVVLAQAPQKAKPPKAPTNGPGTNTISMTAMALWQQRFPLPLTGLEINPDDPQGLNWNALNQCVNHDQRQGCEVWLTPGTYYLKKPVALPLGVMIVHAAGVKLYPCAAMPALIEGYSSPPYQCPDFDSLEDLRSYPPCGTFDPYAYPPTQPYRCL